MTTPPRIPRWKKALYGVLAAAFLFAVIEGLASFALALRAGAAAVQHHREEAHCDHDPDLGWMNRKGFHAPDLFGKGRGFTTNERGFRSSRPLPDAVPQGRSRVVFVGDSFTEGYGVGDADSFPALIESTSPRIEAVNMGLGGFGLDQMLIWYRRDATFEASLVVVACVAHDFERLGPEGAMGYPDPSFRLVGGKLELAGTPVPAGFGKGYRDGTRSFLAELALGRILGSILDDPPPRRAHRSAAETPASEAQDRPEWVALVRPILEEFRTVARSRGSALAFAYLPSRYTLTREPTLAFSLAKEACVGLGIPFLDLRPLFADLPASTLDAHFIPDGHYSRKGNELVAAFFARELDALLQPR